MTDADRCALCGTADTDGNLEQRLVHWSEPDAEGNVYAFVARCRIQLACQERVHRAGRPWPIADVQPPRTQDAPGPPWRNAT